MMLYLSCIKGRIKMNLEKAKEVLRGEIEYYKDLTVHPGQYFNSEKEYEITIVKYEAKVEALELALHIVSEVE